MLQATIFVSSALAIWLLASPSADSRRLGCVIGMAGQPVWLYVTANAEQWGIFALALWYLLAYARGWYQHRPADWDAPPQPPHWMRRYAPHEQAAAQEDQRRSSPKS